MKEQCKSEAFSSINALEKRQNDILIQRFMKLFKYLIFLFLFLVPTVHASHTFRVEGDYMSATTQWNEYSTVNQIRYSSAYRVTGEYLLQFNERLAIALGGSLATYSIEDPIPAQAIDEESISALSLHGNGIMLFGRDLFTELGFYLMRIPYFGNAATTTTAIDIAAPAIKVGLGVNARLSFGLMRVIFRNYFHLNGTFEQQEVSGMTQEYRTEFFFGRTANYGVYLKFQTSAMEGDYELVTDERAIGLIFRLSTAR